MKELKMLYEGKAKQIFETEVFDELIVYYKDDTTAFNGIKKAQVKDKGILNNKISSKIFEYLTKNGIKNHFVKQIDDRRQLCKIVDVIPLEVICRNYIAGSLSKKLDIEEGTKTKFPIIELCYKNDDLSDPFINDYHALNLDLCTKEELEEIYNLTKKINKLLFDYFDKRDIILIDFKIEFGRNKDGEIILADEISPDSSRFWDKITLNKLDKDRFRRDLGNVIEGYKEILKRIEL